ncbi:MAG: helix-turn-helix domain-containing protein [Clostridia bacterium]|nr:helix-turn-helix domain-containing protein [Clostridia bacterium]
MRNIKLLRILNDYTQEQLANALHVSRSCYCQYELGTRNMDYGILLSLASLYSVPQEVVAGVFEDMDFFNMYLSLSPEDANVVKEYIKNLYLREKETRC